MFENIEGKKVLIRVDFNVPLNKQFEITDDTRMQKALPTIQYLLKEGASVILMSHFGRPQKKKNADGSINKQAFSLKHLTKHLSDLLESPILFAEDCIGRDAFSKSLQLKSGEVLLLENTRFEEGEKKGDEVMGAKLAKLADFFINDAFGAAHRNHASTTTVAKYFKPEHRCLGLLMQNEIENAKKVLNSPKRPCTAILGGAKVSDKIKLIERLIDFVNHIIIGGGMSYTFIKAKGGKIGNSLVENDYLDLALEILEKAEDRNVDIYLPTDTIAADQFAADASTQTVKTNQIPDDWMGLDIGPEAIDAYSKVINSSKTILWNGPVGVFEFDNFSNGTMAIAQEVANVTEKGAFTLVGGGDSVSAINKAGLADKVSFVSTGGGAMLEFLEGKKLPGIAAIESKEYVETKE